MSNQLQITGAAKIRTIQGPVVANSGVITALNGDATEYVRGDGTLADFPTSTGGGSSVSYYLNTSVSQGTIGGVAYKQLSKVPISGAGTDVSTSVDGYIASYITDANDPALLEVPAGNFNCEFYFSVNSNAHNPYVYAEVYKYDGTTFTLLGSNVSIPQYLSNGTTLSPYYFAIAVSTAVLTVTDRIAIRIYVNVDTRTVTLHTENNHLCQVVTTFSKGLISLNNLTRQNQFFQTGTSGTDFAISSATATHTFNLPVASASNTGKLSSSDWSTFNGKVPYTGANANVDLGAFDLIAANGIFNDVVTINATSNQARALYMVTGTAGVQYVSGTGVNLFSEATDNLTILFTTASTTKNAILNGANLTAARTYTLPNASGTIALTSDLGSYLPLTGGTLSGNLIINPSTTDYTLKLSTPSTNNTIKLIGSSASNSGSIGFFASDTTTSYSSLSFTPTNTKFEVVNSGSFSIYTSGNERFTIASNGTNTFSGSIIADGSVLLKNNVTSFLAGYVNLGGIATGYGFSVGLPNGGTPLINQLIFNSSAAYNYTFPAATGTIALGTGTTNYHAKWTGTNTIGNSLIYDNGTNVGIGNQGTTYTLDVTGSLRNTTSAYFATTSGSVGIGTILANKLGADKALTINGATDSLLELAVGDVRKLQMYHGGTNAQLNNLAAGSLTLITNGISALTLASTGAATFSSSITASGNLNLQAGTVRNINFYDSSNTNINAQIQYDQISATSGQLFFGTNNAGTFATRLTIASTGNVGIGTSSPSAKLDVTGTFTATTTLASGYAHTLSNQSLAAGANGLFIDAYSASSSSFALAVRTNDGNSYPFKIRCDGYLQSATTYNNTTATGANLSISSSGFIERSTSSIRFKTEVEDLKIDTSNILSKMRPIWYRSLGQNDRKDWSWYGFIAEEMAEIEPRLVHWGKDENDNDIADGVQYERITVLLVAEIQKMNQTIQNLQEQINILAK